MLSRLKNWAAGAAIVGGVVAAGYWANNEYLAWRDRTEATEVLHKRYNVTQVFLCILRVWCAVCVSCRVRVVFRRWR